MSRNYTENLLTLDINKILGVGFKAPNFEKLYGNFITKSARIPIDINYLLFQHNTTGYKLGVSAYYLSQMTELSGFDIHLDVDENGNRFYKGDLKNYILYVMSIDNFFVSCWGAITSICRELWNAYGLKLDVRKVNFYFVKLRFEKEYANVTRFLQSVNDKEWFQYLNGARTGVEHGQILMIEIRGDTGGTVIADDQNVDRQNYDQ